jgi:hypothetical protein
MRRRRGRETWQKNIYNIECSPKIQCVADPGNFGTDPDPRIHRYLWLMDPDLAFFVSDLQDVIKNYFFAKRH